MAFLLVAVLAVGVVTCGREVPPEIVPGPVLGESTASGPSDPTRSLVDAPGPVEISTRELPRRGGAVSGASGGAVPPGAASPVGAVATDPPGVPGGAPPVAVPIAGGLPPQDAGGYPLVPNDAPPPNVPNPYPQPPQPPQPATPDAMVPPDGPPMPDAPILPDGNPYGGPPFTQP